jgi:glycosyltransferase involved in cell wall biosynthesis
VKTKVVWIIDSLGPGGAENITLSLMKNFNKEKFDLRVCVLQVREGNPIAKKLEQVGIPVDLVSVPTLRHPANLPKIISYLLKHRPQLVHTQLEFSDILGSLGAKLLGIPSVSTLHTVGLIKPEEDQSAHWRNELMWFCQRHFMSRVIAVSDDTRKFHVKEGRLPKDKVITLYNGIDLAFYKDNSQSKLDVLKASLGLPFDATVLLTVAVLREQKGIQYMIKAMPTILEVVPNLYYLVVGDGEYRETLENLTLSLDLDKHVLFTGHRSDIPEILTISDIFVLPTLTEALPTVLMEAMAAKKAIVASNVGGVPELVTDGANGLLVPPSDPSELSKTCLHLIQNEALKNKMSTEGFSIMKKQFTIQLQVDKLSTLYMELINNE